jgi:serine/alanine adding enzyme
LSTINTVKHLIKRKIQIAGLECYFPNEKQAEIEGLITEAEGCLKGIKVKIKEKSKITRDFKNPLDEEQRRLLKIRVSKATHLIKQLEHQLKEKESKLAEILTQGHTDGTPSQFRLTDIEREVEGEFVFSVIKSTKDSVAEWESFLSSFSAHSTYHRLEWLQALSEYSGHKKYFFVLKVDGKIVAGAPALFMQSALFGSNLISIPFVNYGGVLSYSKKLTLGLLDGIRKWAKDKQIDYVEFRTTMPRLNLPVKSRKCSMILKLPSSDVVLDSELSAKVRAQCKKASAYNPKITFGGLELLEQFYYVFSTNMRDLGTPVYGRSLFKKILQEKKIDSFICIVTINNKPVSAAFLTGYRDMLEIPWASTLKVANKYDANMWMYRMILQRAIVLKYKYFDFGRSTKNSNTHRFKKQWGAKPIDHHWYYQIESGLIPETNPDNPKYQFFIALWKLLPVWLANIVGPHIVKNIP